MRDNKYKFKMIEFIIINRLQLFCKILLMLIIGFPAYYCSNKTPVSESLQAAFKS